MHCIIKADDYILTGLLVSPLSTLCSFLTVAMDPGHLNYRSAAVLKCKYVSCCGGTADMITPQLKSTCDKSSFRIIRENGTVFKIVIV